MDEIFFSKMEKLLSDKIKEFKEKEAKEFNTIKQEYEIKVKAFRDKYKQLEENDFNYLESEYSKLKEKMESEYSMKIKNFESKFKMSEERLKKQVCSIN